MVLLNSPEALQKQILEVEGSGKSIPSTARASDELFSDLGFTSQQELIDYIWGNRVLDVGSGYSMLAIEAILKGIPGIVISVNPVMESNRFKEYQLRNAVQTFPDYSLDAIEEACRIVSENTYPYFAHDLRFPDKSYERVIDTNAVFHYAHPHQGLAFARSVREMHRVSKETVRASAGGITFGRKHRTNWRERILIGLGLKYKPFGSCVEIYK